MAFRYLEGFSIFVVLFTLALTTGCGDDNNGEMPAATTPGYTVTVTNLTNNQPLSPVAVILHGNGYTGWMGGDSASAGLEALVEGGDPSDFLAEAITHGDVAVTATGSGIILPGASEEVPVSTVISGDVRLTMATMLVNTNDAFTGFADKQIGGIGVGDHITVFAHAYDAGTEANTETAVTVPGPAGGGEGFNVVRDDLSDSVAVHRGVVTSDDGLVGSALDESHRFVNPVARIIVKRIQ